MRKYGLNIFYWLNIFSKKINDEQYLTTFYFCRRRYYTFKIPIKKDMAPFLNISEKEFCLTVFIKYKGQYSRGDEKFLFCDKKNAKKVWKWINPHIESYLMIKKLKGEI